MIRKFQTHRGAIRDAIFLHPGDRTLFNRLHPSALVAPVETRVYYANAKDSASSQDLLKRTNIFEQDPVRHQYGKPRIPVIGSFPAIATCGDDLTM